MGYGLGYTPNERPLRRRREGPFRAQIDGRGDWIRTSDLLNPIQVRYQAALRPDVMERAWSQKMGMARKTPLCATPLVLSARPSGRGP
jgi:hypothetical protein